MKLPITYTLFAVLATAVNIGVQDIAVTLYQGPYSLILSVTTGTVAGLALKYVLDKRYIFRFQANDALHDSRTFMLYSLMGVVTTLIFWSFEFGFNALFETKEMRYLGGIIGLAIGYTSKYHLDRQFVFRKGATV
ncbi:MAG: GtrA family protein [Chlorobiaceae bacterium]|nr:GtrA family protein [Chlorobiaceae bacterium]